MSQAIYHITASPQQMDDIPDDAILLPIHQRMTDTLDKSVLLASLGQACGFLSDAKLHWSQNWDSAYDCLTDALLQGGMCHLLLDLSAVDKINTEDLNTFKSLITDAYSDFGKTQLWIVL